MIKELDIVVHDDYGIVYHDTEDYYECRNRYLVQGDADSVHDPHSGEERDRDCEGRNNGNADRQKDDSHQNDSDYGKQEFVTEIRYALPDHSRLIRDNIDVYVGRQQGSKLSHDFVKAITQFGDILALLHLDGQQYARLSIEADQEDRVLVAPLNLCEVLDIDRLSCSRNVDHHISDLVFRGKGPRCSHGDL